MEVPSGSWASSAATRATMRANRSRDTKPEMILRRAVHAMGLRYRVSVRPLPGFRRTADLVFKGAKVAVFVDGCFWHGCSDHHVPARSNAAFWAEKARRNRERDADTNARLASAGWIVLRFWEHEDLRAAAETVAQVVRERSGLNHLKAGVPRRHETRQGIHPKRADM
jgi:DNA mismatch endonuclease, patch repair protein